MEQEKRLSQAKQQYREEKADNRLTLRFPTNKKLSASEKRKVNRAIKKAKRDGKIPKNAQETIPYKRMYPDGMCRVNDRLYTKTIQFFDMMLSI